MNTWYFLRITVRHDRAIAHCWFCCKYDCAFNWDSATAANVSGVVVAVAGIILVSVVIFGFVAVVVVVGRGIDVAATFAVGRVAVVVGHDAIVAAAVVGRVVIFVAAAVHSVVIVFTFAAAVVVEDTVFKSTVAFLVVLLLL